MSFGILASGNLGFSVYASLFEIGLRPTFLFTDRSSDDLQTFSSERNIPLFIGSPRNGQGMRFLESISDVPDVIISVNYIFLLPTEIIEYPKFGCVNIHGSLLPKYRGRSPHVWAIINNENETGITVHYIDSGCDTGAVIFQEIIKIDPTSTGGSLTNVFRSRYPAIVLRILGLFNGEAPVGRLQDESKATYFGKRTPEDGKINWQWQKERIYNWVRAQSDPYPGAFSYYNCEKVIIDAVEFRDSGFAWDLPNGYIISGGKNPEVKTPNGVIKIVKQRTDIDCEKSAILT